MIALPVEVAVEVALESFKGAASFVASAFPKGGIDFKHKATTMSYEIASVVALFFLFLSTRAPAALFRPPSLTKP